MKKEPCDGCDREHENLTLVAGRGLCPTCLTIWKESEQRVVEDVIIIAHDCMDGFAYIPVETFKDKLKQKYGVK